MPSEFPIGVVALPRIRVVDVHALERFHLRQFLLRLRGLLFRGHAVEIAFVLAVIVGGGLFYVRHDCYLFLGRHECRGR